MRFQFIAAFLAAASFAAPAAGAGLRAGAAAVDITPDHPVRLSGFGFRRAESEGITQRIWAKALAIAGEDGKNPAVLVTVDNLGVPASMTKDLATRLAKQASLDPARLAVTSSHTHTAPMLTGVCATLFGQPIPPEHQQNIDRYTQFLAAKLEEVCLAALKDLKPATIEFAAGTADLAANRRTKGGPVDHDLPVLVVKGSDGKPRAIYVSYACHCVTLSNNHVSGDWAGFVQETIEKNHPGVIALTSIGCGADANPASGVTGDKVDVAAAQGKQIAAEVDRVLRSALNPVAAPPTIKTGDVELLFDTHPTRAEWEEKAKRPDAVGYHAKVQLEKLDRGEPLQTKLPYPIQTWTFGDELAMVFLPGEVVVDYSLRLKKEFDRTRLWVNAYSNDNPCYIPSERILKEGGYEGGGAMVYYDRPTRLAAGVERKIIDEVRRQLPESFRAPPGTEGVAPKSPEQSRRSMRVPPGIEVELVAAEPLVASPVAIDWSADGRLWVCEMFDYPAGADGEFKPGGRVKFLEDSDGDGRYDKATVFLENIPFPTGVTAWGRGVYVCAAPDILFAQDTDDDGKADKVETVFTGFATDNYQARINSLSLGLDNYLHGANGLLGGVITSGIDSGANPQAAVDIRGRDFRFRPPGGPIETVTGLTQQGRVRDDWGRWFGCDNGTSLMYYPHEERYLRRNPHAPSPAAAVRPAADYDVGRVFPASRMLERFNDPDNANTFTSGCGLGIYRDTLLGEQYAGNAFTCEPVHNLVHRMVLKGDGTSLSRRRGTGEDASEFFASTDNWSRPVQVRTGPDGALYVVDMYRFLVEHPRWIAPTRLAQLDVRAGADKGRVYRLRPSAVPLRTVRDLTKLGAAALVAALNSSNGTERDRVHAELLYRRDKASAPYLEALAQQSRHSQVQVQALCALEGMGALRIEAWRSALKDPDSRVREHAVRLSEASLPAIGATVLRMVDDPSPGVRRQLAFTLGEWRDPRAGVALATLARNHPDDPETRTAVLTSAGPHCAALLAAAASLPQASRAQWIPPLAATAAASGDEKLLAAALDAILPVGGAAPAPAHFVALAGLLEVSNRNPATPRDVAPAVSSTFAAARRVASDDAAAPASRAAAVRLLGLAAVSPDDLNLICDLAARGAAELRAAALAALRKQTSRAVAERLVAQWRSVAPAARGDLVNLLTGRDEWAAALLRAVKGGTVAPGEIALVDRVRLARSPDEAIRNLAAEVFPTHSSGSRSEIVSRYASVASLAGDASKGKEFFARDCAACHQLNGVGHAVGPDLSALRGKHADYFVHNILDPAAVVEPRFVYYQVVTRDRRSIAGLLKSETQTALVLQGGNGVTETVARPDVKEVRAAGTSMMPDGFEAAYTPAQLADLVAFLKSPPATALAAAPPLAASHAPPGNEVARDPKSVASVILDKSLSDEVREAAVKANPQFAAELITEMTRDLVDGTPAEYERIPWIWRVAVACGRRNDAAQMKKVLAVSLPRENEPLRDWQAVVIGGGVVMGVSERGQWPAKRVAEILAGDDDLLKRYHRSLDLASAMSDNEKVRTPTRYDALRMLGAEPWEKRGAQLTRYLAQGTHAELQQGAVGGVADVDAPEAAAALVSAVPHLPEENRNLAIDALLKNESRVTALLDAMEARKIDPAVLDAPRREKLLKHTDERLRERAKTLIERKE